MQAILDEAVAFAAASPKPAPETALAGVYGETHGGRSSRRSSDQGRTVHHDADHAITYSQAIYDAMREEMDRDPNVILIGEDVGHVRRRLGRVAATW